MKKLILIFATLLFSNIYSQPYVTFFDYDTLNINNIRLMSSNVGNSDGYGGFWEILSGDEWNQWIIFDHGPWIIGKIGSDTVLSLSQWFSSYSPGPIINGQAAMLIHPEDSLKYRSYKITRGDDNTNPDYAEWPVEFGAPVDGEGKPLIHGDQTLWTAFNSMDSTVTHVWWHESLDPFPVEFHQTAFARTGSGNDGQDIFANTVFLEWEIINKANQQIDSTFFGFWTDIDFEIMLDNRPGIDTERQVGYCWTNNALTFYDSTPPAVGYSLLYGPVVPSVGHTATYKGEQLANYENLTLSSFRGIGDDSYPPPSLYSPARSMKDAWNIARGFDSQGNVIIDPTTGSPTKFPLSGDPVTGDGWIYESGTGGGAGFVFFSGPFTLAPNDTQWAMIALIPGLGESNLNSVTQMRRKTEILRSLPYDSLAFGTLSYPITDVEYEQTPFITDFRLEQNYPNPFNPSTKIKFTIPSVIASETKQSQMVTLKVYDVLGNEMTTLINEELTSGEYEVEFSSHSGEVRNLTSGIYFYTLRTGDFVQSKKMVLMK
jgi:hypothetical protein